jgi:hypothetical protein
VALDSTTLNHLLGLLTHALAQSAVLEFILTDSLGLDKRRNIREWISTRRENEDDRVLVGRALIDLVVTDEW